MIRQNKLPLQNLSGLYRDLRILCDFFSKVTFYHEFTQKRLVKKQIGSICRIEPILGAQPRQIVDVLLPYGYTVTA